METRPDFQELLELFNAHSINFVIVGAHSLEVKQGDSMQL